MQSKSRGRLSLLKRGPRAVEVDRDLDSAWMASISMGSGAEARASGVSPRA
ncbi:hypothetical protein PF010_g15491 [Phytophthora fragariae]|uniref:Uncharacterized protein n=1 Tax=Phytophthora fragariae TaxID=53985 RepID=A0A6G0QG06_9STRA|nr:hypothetical protein PF003_g6378 [Phytophthora fragariae]KAE9098604.1 hypothetical protein PF010_g15491 [Phytophthora fragariae]KAE9285708.1 hypothetical protein PF008_g26848 [Phytophthora fragariae]